MQIVSRSDARAAGRKRFFSGVDCPHGHASERLVSNGTCISCSKERQREWWLENRKRPPCLVSKEQAVEGGLRYFDTGRPCTHGHLSERRVSDGKCRECARIKTRKRRLANPNYAKVSIQKWALKNPEARRVYTSRRRKLEKSSTDHYRLADVRKLLILQKNKCASCLCVLAANSYHVDHVMPLFLGGDNSKRNIQILCPKCNLRKAAKHPIDWAAENGRLL